MTTIVDLWHHLQAQPALWLCLTLLSYQLGIVVYRKTGYLTVFSPFVIAVAILMTVVISTDTPYDTFFEGAKFVHFLLGPATVALAVPLFDQRRRLAKLWAPILSVSLWVAQRGSSRPSF